MTEFGIVTDDVTDISPVRPFPRIPQAGLKHQQSCRPRIGSPDQFYGKVRSLNCLGRNRWKPSLKS